MSESPPNTLAEMVERLAETLNDPTAPEMGVHTMSEFIFCHFAGAVTFEKGTDDEGTERAPALGGLPTHDIDLIRKELEHLSDRLKMAVASNLGLAISIVILFQVIGVPALVFLVTLYYTYRWLKRDFQAYRFLRGRLKLAESAEDKEPKWLSHEVQEIDWWNLIRAGFTSIEKQKSLESEELRIRGKPWRVLQKGSQHYPVLRINTRGEDDPIRSGNLHPQQFARIAAYAFLLHRKEMVQSEWAIILFDGTDQGIAVPITQRVWEHLERGLLTARSRFANYRDPDVFLPKPPVPGSLCTGCPHGEPRRAGKPTILRGEKIAARLTDANDGYRYHSTCGDRFVWTPPHKKAKEKNLVR